MFVNCKHCHALVATDPATDLPPERCPRCAGVLRLPQAAPTKAAAGVDAPAAEPSAAAQESSTRVADGPSLPQATANDQSIPAIEAAPEAALQDALAAAADTASASIAPDPATPRAPIDPAPARDAAAPSPAIVLDESAAPAGNADTAAAEAAVANPAGSSAAAPTQAPAAAAVADASQAPTVDVATAIPPVAADAAATGMPQAPADTTTTTIAAPSPVDPSAAVATGGPGFLSKAAPGAATPAAARRWPLTAAIASLALLLGLQVLLADRDRLAADARWRPLVASVCGLFGCSIPAWHEPAAFTLLARDVRPHPDARNALRVSATFRNDARWTQDWPRLVLTLSDVDGRPVAARAFDAGEYLGPAATAAGLDPGQRADIALDIREPSTATVSYAFDFR